MKKISLAFGVCFFIISSLCSGDCLSDSQLKGELKRIPVVLDTDIGSDYDDMWAVAMILQCPELDVRLITTATGDTTERARILAKLLQLVGREDIPIGVGVARPVIPCRQKQWLEDFEMSCYKGKVYQDGVGALIDTIMNCEERVKLIAIGPLTNIAEALEREPKIAKKADFVGMHGSLRIGYDDNRKAVSEYNVRKDIKAAQKVFSAEWPMTITPLDTCGLAVIEGQLYQDLLHCESDFVPVLIEGYKQWIPSAHWIKDKSWPERRSSILYDTVAVYLAINDEFLVMEDLGVRVDKKGYTKIDGSAKKIRCATYWKDKEGFLKYLAVRIENNKLKHNNSDNSKFLKKQKAMK